MALSTPSLRASRGKRRPMSDINVVPYIDVMLVLLVIFMVTAPLMQQGVEIELPQASADPIPPQQRDPVIVRVDKNGNFHLSLAGGPAEQLEAKDIMVRVAAVMRRQADTPVMVGGDRDVPYGRVIEIMAQLQQAGVPKVGLLTDPPR